MMVHILKNKASQYYWLSVSTKANTFFINGESSEYYTSKQNCLKSIWNEAEIFGGLYRSDYKVIDHTKKINTSGLQDWQVREVEWVRGRKK